MGDRLRVAIIDDHPLFREGVVHTLRSAARVLDVVGEGGTAEDAVRIAKEELPDILLLDVSMPGGGIEAARLIARVCPIVKMIMLTVSENEDDVAQSLEAGAKGYVLKGTSGPELLKTMFAISRGESYVTPGLAARLLTHAIRQEPSRLPALPELTERSRRILRPGGPRPHQQGDRQGPVAEREDGQAPHDQRDAEAAGAQPRGSGHGVPQAGRQRR